MTIPRLIRVMEYTDGRIEEVEVAVHNPINPATAVVKGEKYYFVNSRGTPRCPKVCALYTPEGVCGEAVGAPCTPNHRPDMRMGYWAKNKANK